MDEPTAAFFGTLVVDATAEFIDTLEPPDDVTEVFRQFAGCSARWASARPTPFALTHGDYRLDNLMFPPAERADDQVIALDWGVTSVGLPLRDLTLLLTTGLDAETRRPLERSIVDAYHERLVELGVSGYDADDCWADYRYALFYPLTVTALGWAYSNRSGRGDRMFGVMIERAVSAIVDHDPFSLI
jgi:aminoglycoside phosphotransferase (APT) family kinase protein